MPVLKFHDIQELNRDRWYEAGDPRLFEAMRAVLELSARTLQPRFPPGVYKHRSIESMNRLQEEWARANFEAYLARRKEKLHELEGASVAEGSSSGES